MLRAISQWDGSPLTVTFNGLEMGELGRTTHQVELRGYHSLFEEDVTSRNLSRYGSHYTVWLRYNT